MEEINMIPDQVFFILEKQVLKTKNGCFLWLENYSVAGASFAFLGI